MTTTTRGPFLIALLSTSVVACSTLIDSPPATFAADPPEFWNARSGPGSIASAVWFHAPTRELYDNFGSALSLQDGELLVVAATAQLTDVRSDAAESCGEIIDAERAGRTFAFDRLDDSWIETGELRRDQARTDEGIVRFGTEPVPRVVVAQWGDIAAIGVPMADVNRCDPGVDTEVAHAGKVYLFARAGDGRWIPSSVLISSSPGIANYFGTTVALSEDELFVGATGDEVSAAQPGAAGFRNSGAVYVFKRDGTSWHEVQRIEPSHPQIGASFGIALSVDGDTLAIGAWQDAHGDSDIHAAMDPLDPELPAVDGSGAVYLYRERQGRWEPTDYVKAPAASSGALFGVSVALDGDLLLVGAPFDSGHQGSTTAGEFAAQVAPPDDLKSAGVVYAYRRDDAGWRFDEYLEAFEPRAGSRFGFALSIRANLILVSAPWEDDRSGGPVVKEAGAAYLYARTEEAYSPVARLAPRSAPNHLLFGYAAALGERVAVIGAPAHEVQAGSIGSFTLQE